METKHYIVHKENMKWDDGMYPGTSMCYLWEEPETGRVVFLVKVDPGGRIPLHNHLRREIAYLVEGEVRLNEDIMKAGDFLVAAGEQAHDVYTETGCTFFIYIDYNPQKNELVNIETNKE
ncbi:cupin domain-containing protein [Bacillus sp. 166amftsu]|uniref:cupin domain-containing protein n=1 Tax=Bacillus sp. 166amftsu TaxID=1761753 RepID=UPI000895C37F|nr:cupin domain-containing protein [Bacillus sp. 166amftsu]SDZ40597.1 ChrR Cupin-like domain-containing protein [Bacillus sp. 166amftsu]